MTELAIELRGVVKRFGAHVVLDGIDVAVARGEILGYVGPNGSGKSTTVKILIGMIADYEGLARVAGFDPREQALEVKRRVGYVPENAVLYEQLTVAELLLFVGRLRGMGDAEIEERAERFLEVFEIRDRLQSRISTLSKGMRQKLLLTSAILHDPRVLLLDEPLSGLDVHAAILVKQFLRGLADKGTTILFCSHVMDVVEKLCDRVAILHGGKLVAIGTLDELRARSSEKSLESIFATLTGDGGQGERAQRLLDALG